MFSGLTGREQVPVFEELPGDGAGSDIRFQVFRVADPGDAVRVHPHTGTLDTTQVYVGDGGLVADAMQVCTGPVDWLPGVVAQGVFE
jgi:hypothetical protein